MKYLKLYEDFKFDTDEEIIEPEVELSDKTVDDVLSDDFFNDEYDETYVDNRGVIHIKNWKEY